jgi:small subunit ribosomal protein S1
MDWTNKNIHPSKVVSIGDDVEVMILDIEQDRRRISLGIKQCQANPWESFGTKYQKDDKVSGKIKSITDFGIFIGLEGGIDGLVHLSDISWEDTGEEAVRNFGKGDELETVILSIDPERERISLGIKQLTSDPFGQYVSENDRNAIVKGKVTAVDAKAATVELAEGVEATLKASEMSRERVEDLSAVLNVGDEVEAKIITIDRKNRTIALSVKAKDMKDEPEAPAADAKSADAQAPKTIGDLIKAQLADK